MSDESAFENSTTLESLVAAQFKQSEPQAETTIISRECFSSEPDLYLGKLKIETRLKHALQYELSYESPLVHVQRFFEGSFSPCQRRHSSIRQWQEDTESYAKNTLILPLGLWINPVYLAAAYLDWTKKNMVKLQHELKGSLPETINGSPWYHYVDPAIDANQLEEVSNILNDEFTFLLNLFESDDAEQDSQLPAQIRGQEEEE